MTPLPPADVLLVVPPLAHLTWPSLGVHVLQAVARERGYAVRVLYANMRLAERIGVLEYANLCNAPGAWLLGERLFASVSRGLDGLGGASFAEEIEAHNLRSPPKALRYVDHLTDAAGKYSTAGGTQFSLAELRAHAEAGEGLIDDLARAIAAGGYRAVGVSTSFDQTNFSLALLAAVKERSPEIVTLLGGANCEGAMADGVAGIGGAVDHVFDGESEQTFVDLLDALAAGESRPRILRGSPCLDLDALPTPDFADYFEARVEHQVDEVGAEVWLSYETSRGCWWGAKSHCTFCGLNGQGMGFRQKSADRVLEDLAGMVARYPTKQVCMTDNIMPHGYHRTLVPRLAERVPGVHVFYEQKSNLSLEQLKAMVDGGIRVFQPGIESLSTPVLGLMRKGVTARQNVVLLRNARCLQAHVKWNLLYAFPGDDAEHYAEMLAFLPRLHHLAPPNALTHLSIDRFSPYHSQPEHHGVRNIRPLDVYREVFGEDADLDAVAYHFDADWESGSRGATRLMRQLWDAVADWRLAWDADQAPTLWLSRRGQGWVLLDTRAGEPAVYELSAAQAYAVAIGGPLAKVHAGSWAVTQGFALELDGWCVPLALATYADLLAIRDAGQAAAWVTVLHAAF